MNKRLARAIVFGFLVLILILFVIEIRKGTFLRGKISMAVGTYGAILLFIICAVLDFIPQSIGPHFPLAAAVLAGINPITGLIATSLGSAAGTLLAFELGRKTQGRFMETFVTSKNKEQVKATIEKYGKWGILIAALAPVIPYPPLLFGAIGVSRKDMILYGIGSRTLSYIFVALFVSLFT
jgi:membrane protein YqaA with SNARE-associated domain